MSSDQIYLLYIDKKHEMQQKFKTKQKTHAHYFFFQYIHISNRPSFFFLLSKKTRKNRFHLVFNRKKKFGKNIDDDVDILYFIIVVVFFQIEYFIVCPHIISVCVCLCLYDDNEHSYIYIYKYKEIMTTINFRHLIGFFLFF